MKLEPPNNLDQLCLDLGIGLKRRARLSEEKGKSLVPWLQKVWVWTRRQDRGRFLHPHATAGVPDYVDNPAAGMREEPEAVSPDEIGTYRKSRDARDAYQAEQLSEVGNLLGALRDVRAAIDEMPPEKRQAISRTLWTLKGRLDAAEQEIRRRVAA